MVNMMGGSSGRKKSELDSLLELTRNPGPTEELIARRDASAEALAKEKAEHRQTKAEAEAALQRLDEERRSLNDFQVSLNEFQRNLNDLNTQLQRKHMELNASLGQAERDRVATAEELDKQRTITQDLERRQAEFARGEADLKLKLQTVAEKDNHFNELARRLRG